MNMDAPTAKSKIDHLKRLLECRREEYAVFGRTSEDAEHDAEIQQEIKNLERVVLLDVKTLKP